MSLFSKINPRQFYPWIQTPLTFNQCEIRRYGGSGCHEGSESCSHSTSLKFRPGARGEGNLLLFFSIFHSINEAPLSTQQWLVTTYKKPTMLAWYSKFLRVLTKEGKINTHRSQKNIYYEIILQRLTIYLNEPISNLKPLNFGVPLPLKL